MRIQPTCAAKKPPRTWRSSAGPTTTHVSQAGYKQVRDQQVTRSFPSQPACNEWRCQIIHSVTALNHPRTPAKDARPQDKDLQAVLCAPPFCDCLGQKTAQNTGAIILGSSVQVTLAREPCESKEDLAAVKKTDWQTVPSNILCQRPTPVIQLCLNQFLIHISKNMHTMSCCGPRRVGTHLLADPWPPPGGGHHTGLAAHFGAFKRAMNPAAMNEHVKRTRLEKCDCQHERRIFMKQ